MISLPKLLVITYGLIHPLIHRSLLTRGTANFILLLESLLERIYLYPLPLEMNVLLCTSTVTCTQSIFLRQNGIPGMVIHESGKYRIKMLASSEDLPVIAPHCKCRPAKWLEGAAEHKELRSLFLFFFGNYTLRLITPPQAMPFVP